MKNDQIPDTDRRSPSLLCRSNSLLLVIDVQEKLIHKVCNCESIAWNIQRLMIGANRLSVPIIVSEQYPEGLGPSIKAISRESQNIHPKRMFSCREIEALSKEIDERAIRQLVICGIESHVCVLQSVLDFLSRGLNAYIVSDAIGSRSATDHEVATQRMESSGAFVTTTEGVLFEWCETSLASEFKDISRLILKPFSSVFVE